MKNQESRSTTYYQDIEDYPDSEFELPSDDDVVIYDPLERMNRGIFSFNEAFDQYFLEHVAKFYRKGVPPIARRSIRNFLINLSLPLSAVNSLIQGKVDNSLATFSNFLINSTVGVLGFVDVASEKNLRYRQEDFGQTLGRYGVTSGAFLMIPILGPSSTRDFGGWATDRAVSPLGFNALEIGGKTDLVASNYRVGIAVASGIDTRESLIDIIDDIREDSFDPYATIRSAYLQKRATEVQY